MGFVDGCGGESVAVQQHCTVCTLLRVELVASYMYEVDNSVSEKSYVSKINVQLQYFARNIFYVHSRRHIFGIFVGLGPSLAELTKTLITNSLALFFGISWSYQTSILLISTQAPKSRLFQRSPSIFFVTNIWYEIMSSYEQIG